MRQAKVILYPIAGVYQFYLAATVKNGRMWPLFTLAGIGLIGVAVIKLWKLTKGDQ